jgi:hypothetical protein
MLAQGRRFFCPANLPYRNIWLGPSRRWVKRVGGEAFSLWKSARISTHGCRSSCPAAPGLRGRPARAGRGALHLGAARRARSGHGRHRRGAGEARTARRRAGVARSAAPPRIEQVSFRIARDLAALFLETLAERAHGRPACAHRRPDHPPLWAAGAAAHFPSPRPGPPPRSMARLLRLRPRDGMKRVRARFAASSCARFDTLRLSCLVVARPRSRENLAHDHARQ